MNGRFLMHWLTTAVALGVTAWIVPGVQVTSLPALAVAALVLGFVNAVVKPLLVVLTLPITVLSLGLFYFVVNGLLLWLASFVLPGYSVDGLLPAILGGLVFALVNWALHALFAPAREGKRRS